MTIKDAVIFELKHNFRVSSQEMHDVLEVISMNEDITENAIGSNINFYELVDETLHDIREVKTIIMQHYAV